MTTVSKIVAEGESCCEVDGIEAAKNCRLETACFFEERGVGEHDGLDAVP